LAGIRQFAGVMISTQLDLFGGSPKPPKNIREEESAVVVPTVENKVGEPVNELDYEISEDSSGEPELDAEQEPFHEEMPEWVEVTEMATNAERDELQAHEPYHDVMDAPLAEYVPEIEDEAAYEQDDSNSTYAEPMSEIEEEPVTESEPDAIDENETPLDIEDVQEKEIFIEETLAAPFPDDTVHVQLPSHQDVIIGGDAELNVEDDNTKDTQESREDQLQIPEDDKLFLRQYYTMRETSNMFGVNQSLLRYWENEFDVLKPKKNRKGDRYFRPEDIKNLELIYHLLKVRKFTIEGAREYIKSKKKVLDTFELVQRLEKLKGFLNELKSHL